MAKQIYILLLFFIIGNNSFSQELQARVTINAGAINNTVDKKIFTTLQNQLNDFLNGHKWSGDSYKTNEKVACSFLLELKSIVEPNVYSASLIIQAARPVYASSYQSPLINYQDQDFTFKYVQYQPIEFNDNNVQQSNPLVGNLSAVFAYYAYMILGLDYDSFSPKGGDSYFQKALNIINNAPEASNIKGWKLFDGLRNRYWLNENLVNNKYNIIHDINYSYYRNGLDSLSINDTKARKNILGSLIKLQAFNQENSGTAIVQLFMQSKAIELIGIAKNLPFDDKARAIDLFTNLDVPGAQKYRDALK